MSDMHIMRGLQRGLQVLEALNLSNGSIVSEIASATGLPRTTTYRLLENLCFAGYAYRDPADDRYRLAVDVRRLSAGYEDEAWVVEVAQPAIDELAKDILWPLYVATNYGTSMIIRATTTNRSPLAIDHLALGTRVPMLASASGKSYLGFSSEVEQEAMLNLMERSDDIDHKLSRNRAGIQRSLDKVRADGYAFDIQAKMRSNPGKTSSFGVPVYVRQRVRGALVVRYTDAAMKTERVVERYFEKLRARADVISERVEQLYPDE